MSRIRWYGPTLVLVVSVLLVMLVGPQVVQSLEYHQSGTRIELARQSNLSNLSLAELSGAFRNVAKIVRPSVVHIQIEGRIHRVSRRGDLEEQLRRWPQFFHRALPSPDGEEKPDLRRYEPYERVGTGSGWVYDEAGHIITNNHVVEHGEKIVVTFSDKSKRVATVVGTDPQTDIAVLKVEDNLHAAMLADGPVHQGEIVFAFGSPFGFEFSMSQGIVSAKGRELGILATRHGYENFIQTDAAINRGNSGGPLTNINGQVIGMNTAIATPGNPQANFNGTGFAIPAEMIRQVVEKLISNGRVLRGYLGVLIRDLNEKISWTLGYEGHGVLVEDLMPGSPAASEGLRSGDIITKIDGQPVRSSRELRSIVADYAPGTKVNLEIYRGKSPHEHGQTLSLVVPLAEYPDDPSARHPQRLEDVDESVAEEEGTLQRQDLVNLGLEGLVTATPQVVKRYRRPFKPGILVTQVRPGSAASQQIAKGHIITTVFGVPVKNVDEFLTELAKYDLTKPVRVRVDNGRIERFAVLELPTEDDALTP